MTTKTTGSKERAQTKKVFDDAFESIRKATEANVEMQQEFFRMWSEKWSTVSQNGSENAWSKKVTSAQNEWQETMEDMLAKRREVIDVQVQSAVEAMEGAMGLAQSTSPEEFGTKAQELCRTTLDAVQQSSEAQLEEYQTAVKTWVEMASKWGPSASA